MIAALWRMGELYFVAGDSNQVFAVPVRTGPRFEAGLPRLSLAPSSRYTGARRVRLTPGQRVGPYEVIAPIGRGGMGEVYRARDSRLRREVALKVLPSTFAGDHERVSRFAREAQLLAALNHPNIAAIYGLEEAEGARALVLELVEGPTLAERLAGGPLPVEEALAIAQQIAHALDSAHERGVIHRDLKPANVKLTSDGSVKVLDFGLAKAFDPLAPTAPTADAANSPTLTATATQPGVVLGTAAYMSPEQARGRPVDKRADVWAFGCVLFEMLTGRRAFGGETVAETLAELMKSEPEWQALPADTPPAVRVLLRRCLEKDPRRRLRDIGDARLLMQGAFEDIALIGEATAPAPVSPQPSGMGARTAQRRWGFGVGAGVVLLAALAIGWLLARDGAKSAHSNARFVISAPPSIPVTLRDLADTTHLAISPDGTRVVYTYGPPPAFFLRALDDLVGRILENTQNGLCPFFSPDGQWLGFIQRLELRKVSVSGGAIQTVCKLPEDAAPRGATWSRDGSIVFALEGTGLFRVASSGGTPEALTSPGPTEPVHSWPRFLPDGKALLFEIRDRAAIGPGQLAVLELDSGKWRQLNVRGSAPQYQSGGRLVYARSSALFAAPFDEDRLEVSGDPVQVLEGVTTFDRSGATEFAIALDGSVAYITGEVAVDDTLGVPVWVDRDGKTQPIPGLPVDTYVSVKLSPDGKTLALDRGKGDIWTYDVGRTTLTRLTTNPATDSLPVWTPDGRRIVFRSNRGGEVAAFYWQNADGSGQAERLASFAPPIEVALPENFTPDGEKLLVTRLIAMNMGTAMLSIDGDRELEPLVDSELWDGAPAVSPDGRWVAYHSIVAGLDQLEVFVERFPQLGERRQISVSGGVLPQWSSDGRELYFLSLDGSEVLAVRIETRPRFEAGSPRLLFKGPFLKWWGMVRPFSVAPDGRFVMVRVDESAKAGPGAMVVYAQNWGEDVARKMAAR